MYSPDSPVQLKDTFEDFDDNMLTAFTNMTIEGATNKEASAPEALFRLGASDIDADKPSLGNPFATPSSTSGSSLLGGSQQLISSDDKNHSDTSAPA